MDTQSLAAVNPLIGCDFPDPDAIRVDDAYYMLTTTMHFFPGGTILRSFDLAHWEIFGHVFNSYADTPAARLEGESDIYGKGMWAGSLRERSGVFYACFCSYDTGKTYLYRSQNLAGPWTQGEISGFYHDSSLLFDDDGKAYIAYGNGEIWLTELNDALDAPRPGGLHRLLASDSADMRLRYEGAHLYKIAGRYYLFLIHWHPGPRGRRAQSCLAADSLQGEFRGADVLNDDMGFFNAGVAQGGIVETPDGSWYSLLFQDRGASGRIPVLVPVAWREGMPAFGEGGKVPLEVSVRSSRPGHAYAPVVRSDDFTYPREEAGRVTLAPQWQWNHLPLEGYWRVDGARARLSITTDRLAPNVTRARNVLTQPTAIPRSCAEITVDGSDMAAGDFAGIAAFQGRYGMIALTRDAHSFYVVMKGRPGKPSWPVGPTFDGTPGEEYGRVALEGHTVRLKVVADYRGGRDRASFFLLQKGTWVQVGRDQDLYFGLDHFTGCRFALFMYSTLTKGGTAHFKNFTYTIIGENTDTNPKKSRLQ